MPIHRPPIRDLTPAEFDSVDRDVMGCAFASQNELGRLCDERIYEKDIALRLRSLGRRVETQMPVVVSHRTFSKTYRLDLVCDHAVYDAKTVSALTGAHKSQVLNYAMLLDIRHLKLLNFRTPRVQGQLCFNPITEGLRCQYHIDDSHFRELSSGCRDLVATLGALLQDWGAFLEARLYEEALIHFLGGEGKCVRRIELQRSGNLLGTHEIAMHSLTHFFVLSAVTHDADAYGQHLRRLLRLTGLAGLQWINLNHHRIEIATLT
jgi:GxxExxY protein